MIKLNPASGLPVYLQIIEQVKHLVETGAVQPGDTLPSVRNLATQLVISPNTVIKAYSELEHQGVIELRMGSGAYVRENWAGADRQKRIREASQRVQSVVQGLQTEGFSAEEVRRMFEAELTPERVAAHAVAARINR